MNEKRMTMNSIEELYNLISYFQEVLKFYAESNNYLPVKLNDLGDRYLTMAEIDGGAQARNAIAQAKQLEEINQKAQDDYDKLMAQGYNPEDIEMLLNEQFLIKNGNDNTI